MAGSGHRPAAGRMAKWQRLYHEWVAAASGRGHTGGDIRILWE